MKKLIIFLLLSTLQSSVFAALSPKNGTPVPSLKELASSVVAENTSLSSENINVLETYPKEIQDQIFSKLAEKYLEKKKIYSKFDLIKKLIGNKNPISAALKIYNNLFINGTYEVIKIFLLSKDSKVKLIKKIENLGHWVLSLKVHNNLLFAGSDDGTIHIWKLAENPNQIKFIIKLNPYGIYCIIESCVLKIKGNFLFCGLSNGTIAVYQLPNDPNKIKEIRQLNGHDCCISTLKVYKNILVSGSADGTIGVWSLNNPEKIHLIKKLKNHTDNLTTLKIYKDFLFRGSDNHTIEVWKLSNNSKNIKLIKKLRANNRIINAFKTYNNLLFCSSYGYSCDNSDHSIEIWKLSDNPEKIKRVRKLKDFKIEGFYDNLLFSTSYKGTIGASYKVTIGIWQITRDPNKIKQVQKLKDHNQMVRKLTGHANHLCTNSNDKTMIWKRGNFNNLNTNQSRAIVKFAAFLNEIKEEKKAPDVLPSSLAKHFYKLSRSTLLPEEIIDDLIDEFLDLQQKYAKNKIKFIMPSKEILNHFKKKMTHKTVEKRNGTMNYYWNKKIKKNAKHHFECRII